MVAAARPIQRTSWRPSAPGRSPAVARPARLFAFSCPARIGSQPRGFPADRGSPGFKEAMSEVAARIEKARPPPGGKLLLNELQPLADHARSVRTPTMASKSTPGTGRRTSPASARGRRVARQRVRPRRSLARRPLQTAAGIGRSQGDAGSCDPNWGQSVIHHPPVSSRGERVPWSVRGPRSSPRSPGQLLPAAAGACSASRSGRPRLRRSFVSGVS